MLWGGMIVFLILFFVDYDKKIMNKNKIKMISS